MQSFSEECKVTSALDYASGTADRNGAVIDMAGFDSVAMIVKFATIAASAVTKIKAQQGKLSDGSDMADLAATAIDVAHDDDNQVFVIDLIRPQERYVRLVVDKDAANATAESALYIRYGPRTVPQSNNVTDAVTTERHASPAEGTA